MNGALAALPSAFVKTLWLARTLRTRAAIDAHQTAGVRRLLEHARQTSFYAPFEHGRLADLPIVDKAMMLERFDAFNAQGLDAAKALRIIAGNDTMPGYEIGCSTGTSGTRGLYIISAVERFRWLGTILAKLLPDVMTTRHRVAIVLPGPSPLYQSANESRLLRLAHFDARQGLERIVGDLEAFAPTVLLGAPKTLRGLAMAEVRIRPRKIFAAAEVLDPADETIAQRAFGVPIGHVYMATEGLLGTSCRQGHLHLAEDILAFELEPMGSDPTLVTPLMTDFTRRTQIMARYRIGDLLRLVDGDCACGSAMRRVRVIGRRDDLMIVPALKGESVALAPDALRDVLVQSVPCLDDYRIGLAADGKTLRLLLPRAFGPGKLEMARAALDRWSLARGADIKVDAALADLAAPFDRKLRRIAPVPPETLLIQTAIVTGARAPVALHLARLLHASGRRVILADTLRWPLARATRCKAAYERLPSPTDGLDAYAAAWSRIMERWSANIVVPTCEDVFHLAAVRDIADVPLPLFAPHLDLLAEVHDKYAFASLVRGLGADPPKTIRLRSKADIAALGSGDVVLKPVWSRFGARTLVRPSARHLAAVAPTDADPWVAQTYLPGDEICVCAIAVDGHVRASQAYRPLWRAGLGAAVAFEPVTSEAVDGFVEGFCARTHWTGHVAFDFRHDAVGGLHAIECNPRPTSGVHFFGADDRLADAMAGDGHAKASGANAMTLPLAMATYGLAQALAGGRLRDWMRDMRSMDDIAAWPGEGHVFGAQLKALAEVAWIAGRRRKGLRAAATDDIEWNGNEFPR